MRSHALFPVCALGACDWGDVGLVLSLFGWQNDFVLVQCGSLCQSVAWPVAGAFLIGALVVCSLCARPGQAATLGQRRLFLLMALTEAP